MSPTNKRLRHLELEKIVESDYIPGESLISAFAKNEFFINQQKLDHLSSLLNFANTGGKSIVDATQYMIALEQSSNFDFNRLAKIYHVNNFNELGNDFYQFYGHAIVQARSLERLVEAPRDLNYLINEFPETPVDFQILESAVWTYTAYLCSKCIEEHPDPKFIAEKFAKVFYALQNLSFYKSKACAASGIFDEDSQRYYYGQSQQYKQLGNLFENFLTSV